MKKIFLLAITIALFLGCNKTNSEFDSSGVFEATEVIVSSEVNGKLINLNVEEGQRLKENDVVGLIDTIQLFLKKEQLLYSSKSVQSRKQDINKQIAALKNQINTATKERARIERLLKNNAANKKQLDDIEGQIAVLNSQLSASLSSLERGNNAISAENSALDVQIAQIQDQLIKSRISSPISGVVLVKYAQKGEVTALGKPLFKIADIDNMILRMYVTSSQLNTLKLGQQVKVFADFAKERKEYNGVISWISDNAEFTPKNIQVKDDRENLAYAVKVIVKNDGYLKIGMYADVKF